MVRFGPSGNDVQFYADGFKSTVDAPKWLRDRGLSALEINFGRGIHMGPETAAQIGEQARKYDIAISGHAPYFINLCSPEKDRIAKSYAYIRDSLKVLKVINAADGPMRLVVHIGSQCKQDRGVAIENCKKNLLWVIEKLQKDGLDTFLLCVETMGRYKTIGNVQEICDICKIDKHIIPTIDFGHVNAWEQGSLSKNPNRITEIMQYCCDALGDRMSRPHIHFSAVTYTSAGEHAHTILDDTKWSFAFEPLAKFIKDKRLEPIIICESKGQMAVDAKKLFDIYSGLC